MTTCDHPPTGGFAVLVPELTVFDLAASLRFWCSVLGFEIAYQRAENGFVYLERGGAQVMLELSHGTWETGPLARPLGRGINLMIYGENLDVDHEVDATTKRPGQRPRFPGAMTKLKHDLGATAFQIHETVLGSLIGDLEP